MKTFTEYPWRNNITELISFFAALILFMIALVHLMAVNHVHDNAQRDYRVLQAKIREARNNSDILTESLESYTQYAERGIIGVSKRLSWVETVQNISNYLMIPDMQYTLYGTRAMNELNSAFWNESIAMDMTAMRLDFEMHHGLELIRFFNGLTAQAKGIFSIDKCHIALNADASDDGNLGHIRGECNLLWYSVADVIAHWRAKQ